MSVWQSFNGSHLRGTCTKLSNLIGYVTIYVTSFIVYTLFDHRLLHNGTINKFHLHII